MHNVRRVPVGTLSAEAIAAQREQEQHKLATYKELENAYFKHVCFVFDDSATRTISAKKHWRARLHCCL